MIHKEKIDKLTLVEKINYCSGESFWHTMSLPKIGAESFVVADGPHGVRRQYEHEDNLGIGISQPATCFPTTVTMAQTWDEKLIGDVAAAIGREAKSLGASMILGPGLNIKRHPLCGRNFEYYSEDPYVSGALASAFVNGIQSEGVGACVKHFVANSQEHKRLSSDSVVDERALREIYLSGFEYAIKRAKPQAVMSAYNLINGVYASDNTYLLTDILRDEWGYKGFVVSDWGGLNDRVSAFKAGCDLLMPGGSGYGFEETLNAVENKSLDESFIDQSVDRLLSFAEYASKNKNRALKIDHVQHQKLASDAAAAGAVLLKNQDGLLPIDVSRKTAMIGYMAQNMRFQGSGSSYIVPTNIVAMVDAMPDVTYFGGCDDKGAITQNRLNTVEDIARAYEQVIICIGLTDDFESEGFDRTTLNIPDGHHQMVRATLKHNKNIIIVLMGGSPMDLPWIDDVKAVLYLGLCGQQGGDAVRDLLIGKVNPSGKLTETWPKRLSDVPCSDYYGEGFRDAHYRESIYVGYRYYEKAGVDAQFAFGHGLSYTDFEYKDLAVKPLDKSVHRYSVQFSVVNIGDIDGAEVCQLYIKNPQDAVFRPQKELRRFKKVFLKAGEKKTVKFELDARCFSIYQEGFKVPQGVYYVLVGSSSNIIRCTQLIEIKENTDDVKIPSWQSGSFYEQPKKSPNADDFNQLMGKTIKQRAIIKGELDLNNSIFELAEYSQFVKRVKRRIERNIAKDMGAVVDYDNPKFKMLAMMSLDSAIRSGVMNSGGDYPLHLAKAAVAFANGERFKGIQYLTHSFSNPPKIKRK